MSATSSTATSHYACAASGCPLSATTKLGPDWVCGCHAFAAPATWPAVTTRLNLRRSILKAADLAEGFSPHEWKARQAGAAAAMRKLNREDLVPKVVEHVRRLYDRTTGKQTEERRQRDEREFVRLWVIRLRDTVFRECSDAVPAPVQPQTQARAEGPQSMANLFPTTSSVAQFVSDEVTA